MNISTYDVIYKEIVYKCIDMQPIFGEPFSPDETGIQKPKFLDVACVDSDGHVVTLHDEAFMFRFIRKAGASHA